MHSTLGRLGAHPLAPDSELLASARQQKLHTYGPLLETLRSYLESVLQVLIFPWVVDDRGMVDAKIAAKSVLEILDFIRVSRNMKRRAKIVEDVAIE
jgi:hypothetical protein